MKIGNKLQPVDVRLFTFNKTERSLTCFASDLGPARDGLWWLGQLYDDACDVGIRLSNPDTGKEYVFTLDQEDVRDGELVAWRFTSKWMKPRDKCPAVDTVTIFND